MGISTDFMAMLKENGISVAKFARDYDFKKQQLYRILHHTHQESIIEKLIPYVYGDLRPGDYVYKKQPKKENNDLKRFIMDCIKNEIINISNLNES